MAADLLERKRTHFVGWLPTGTATAPQLIIGEFQAGNPPTLAGERQFVMTPVAGVTGLFEIAAADCQLQDGRVYHYWFEVEDANPFRQPPQRIRCTDPTAYMADWRLLAPALPAPYTDDDRQPAAVIKFRHGQLVACDSGGEEGDFTGESAQDTLPTNNQLVIYELPTAWTRITAGSAVERGVGTFRDVTALVDPNASGANFSDLPILEPGRSYLNELGINALELLPPADSFFKREWGYDTTHFFAPDYELGFPEENSSPTPNSDLTKLVNACHKQGIRFFVDMVMAFARNEPYQHLDFNDFYLADPSHHPTDPDAM